MAVNKHMSGAELTYFDTNCTVCLWVVLRKDCVGTKSDTILIIMQSCARSKHMTRVAF